MTGREKYQKKRWLNERKYYLEALRILAILFVMFNHSPVFMSFPGRSGVGYIGSMALSMVCRCAVPLFFMISGATLLGKSESLFDLFHKRIARFASVLILFSFLFYVKIAIAGEITFSIVGFVNSVLTEVHFGPYWYLYAYLAFLFLLPFLRLMAQNMNRTHVIYLIMLQFIFGVLLEGVGDLTGWWYCSFFKVDAMFTDIIFYPLIGYGLDCLISEKDKRGWKLLLVNLVLMITVAFAEILVYRDFLENGAYRDLYLGFGTSVTAITLFLDSQILFGERLPGQVKNVLDFVGNKVFGIYLLDFIRLNEVVYVALCPYLGIFLSYMVEIFVVFGIRLVAVTIMKQIPVLKKLL